MNKTDVQLRMSGFVLAYLLAPFLTGILYLPWTFLASSIVVLVYAQVKRLPQPETLWHRSILPILGVSYVSRLVSSPVKTLYLLLLLVLPRDSGPVDPFALPGAWVCGAAELAAALALIYTLNRRFSFWKTDLAPDQVSRLSALLAVCTAPYLEIFSELLKG